MNYHNLVPSKKHKINKHFLTYSMLSRINLTKIIQVKIHESELTYSTLIAKQSSRLKNPIIKYNGIRKNLITLHFTASQKLPGGEAELSRSSQSGQIKI